MNEKQRLIIIIIAVADLIAVFFACGIIVSSTFGKQATQSPTSVSANIPSPTPTSTSASIPTWTPTPSPTPYVSPTPSPRPLREEDAALLDQVEQEVPTLRGLYPLHSVSRWKISRFELQRQYADTFVSDEWETAARSWVLVLAAFDFISPGTQLLDLWREGFADSVAGFYLVESEDIYIVSDSYSFGATERLIYAHEFGHALQDQHFDLERLGLDTTSEPIHADRFLAVQSLIEGDAELIQEQYLEAYFSESDSIDLWNDILNTSFTWSDPVPRVLNEISLFPYTYGQDFVTFLHDEGGWQSVNDAYANPPVSTEHVLHPERYLSGDQPVSVSLPPLTDTLSNDWHLIYDGTIGELFLRLYLENQLGAEQAFVAAEGWGGDFCTVYHNETTGQTLSLFRIDWDTAADFEEFTSAYKVYADARFGHSADQVTGALSCWEGTDFLCVRREANSVKVILGPDQGIVDQVLAEAF